MLGCQRRVLREYARTCEDAGVTTEDRR
jgi:hypothetical protein